MSDDVKRLAAECEDFEAPDLAAMHRSELEAEIVHQAKLIERFRQGICNIAREMEDEGDRVYLGSTNDADELRELDEKLTDCGNELFMPWTHGCDLYAELRRVRGENAALEAALREAKETIKAASGTLTEECKLVLKGKRWGHQTLARIDALLNPTDQEQRV